MTKHILFLLILIFGSYSELVVASLIKNQVFDSDGNQRTYDLYLPNTIPNKLSPLVVLLHGHRGDADAMTGENNKIAPYKIWQNIADREGWIVLIPDGEFGSSNQRGWNDCRANATTNPNTDDVKFVNALVDNIAAQYPIDKHRIYVHGTSNGGNMAYRLALESGRKYRAIAAVVASMPAESQCKESKDPVSVLIMNGTKDRILPYEGGIVAKRSSSNQERGSALSTAASIEYWLKNNGISSQPIEQLLPSISKVDRSTVLKKEYLGGRDNTEVVLYEIIGGGHVEPSLSEHYRRVYTLLTGRQNKDIEMAEEVWKFFERNN